MNNTSAIRAQTRKDAARLVRIEDAVNMLQIGSLKRHGPELCGPCPRCGGTDRFAVNVRKQVFNCRRCQIGGDVISLVRHVNGCSFPEAVELLIGARAHIPPRLRHAVERPTPTLRDPSNSGTAQWLWARRHSVKEDTPAARYLRKRGYAGLIQQTLAYLPAREEHPDALIAAFGFASENEPGLLDAPQDVTGVHITRLTPQGEKSNINPVKLTLGPSMGQPIVLAPPNDLLGLAITEGIEDGLSVHQATGLGVWAAGSAGRMPKLASVIPDWIECITILCPPRSGGSVWGTRSGANT
jgi:phage/plasmid primase-like uncharacterized protein